VISFFHSELIQTCVIVVKEEKEKVEIYFFEKESDTRTTYYVQRGITITSNSVTYFNTILYFNVKE
jgi:hypothetical protein